VEEALAQVAEAMFLRGARRFIVAGGETSGAVVQHLGLTTMQVGPLVTVGVPWMAATHNGEVVNLLLKSGNFGDDDIFVAAWDRLTEPV
jgi:uncharacterized protein YgbK (DUF1537 family)